MRYWHNENANMEEMTSYGYEQMKYESDSQPFKFCTLLNLLVFHTPLLQEIINY